MARQFQKQIQKGAVSPFLYIMVAALAVFLLGGWLAGMVDGTVPGSRSQSPGKYLFFEDFGDVGTTEATFFEQAYGDFSVGITTGQRTVYQLNNIWIKNGIPAQKRQTITFEANKPERGLLTFKVLRTNLYGDLTVRVNNDVVFSSKAASGTAPEIKLDELKDGKNTMTITAESSGARFWAPTTYQLADIELKVTDFGKKQFTQTFQLQPYHLRGFNRGEFTFFTDTAQRQHPLTIVINNNTIYEQQPVRRPSPHTATFTREEADLTVGENTIQAFTKKGAAYSLSNALLQIYYFGRSNTTVFHRDMTVRSQDYQRLSEDQYQGKIAFDATVSLPGDMHISFHNTTLDVIPKTGRNSLFFDQTAVKRGKNELSIATDATMELNNFSISVVETR